MNNLSKKIFPGTILFLIITFLSVATPLMASVFYYDANTTASYLDEGPLWQSGATPGAYDDLSLTTASSDGQTVYFRYGGSGSPVTDTPWFYITQVDNTGGGTMIMKSSSTYPGAKFYTDYFDVGVHGSGQVLQEGGTVKTSILTLGCKSSEANGTYTLSGSGTLKVTGSDLIGIYGTGNFIQTSGTHAAFYITMGRYESGHGTYRMDGGTITAENISVGYEGTAEFKQFNGKNYVDSLTLGAKSTGTGSYLLEDGTLARLDDYNIPQGMDELIVGQEGIGEFTQNGGEVTAYKLYLGMSASGNGEYHLSGGTLSAFYEYIGYNGTGVVFQTGGANDIAGYIGLGVQGQGTYYLSNDGTLSASDSGATLTVGDTGKGTFYHYDTAVVSLGEGSLYVGRNSNEDNTYTLAGTPQLYAENIYIGDAGTGTFTQNGGTVQVTEAVTIGTESSGKGLYEISGGTLESSDGDATLRIGQQGRGSFTQTGGSVSLGQGDLYAGVNHTATGSYALSGKSILSTRDEYLGVYGSGTFTQGGGMHHVAGEIFLGHQSGGNGAYTLSGGILSTAGETIGLFGEGSVTQTNGTHSIGQDLVMGSETGSVGAYTMTGGTLDLTGSGTTLAVGKAGQGLFYHSSGSVDLDDDILSVGGAADVTSEYHLSGTGELTAQRQYIGDTGLGAFYQSGSTNTVTELISLGQNIGGNGTYYMTGGTLASSNGSVNLSVGQKGTGTFTHSGGMVDLGTGALYAGTLMGAQGTYTLGGRGNLLADTQYIGVYGSGLVSQRGGTNLVGQSITLGDQSGSRGTYEMTAGSLTFATGDLSAPVYGADLVVGSYGEGLFAQSGGTVTLGTGTLYLGRYKGGEGTYTLSGTGVLTAAHISNKGSFDHSGGTISSSAYFDNFGTFQYSGGTFNGYFHQRAAGSFSLSESTTFTAGQGAINDGILQISDDRTFNANGTGLVNNNQVILSAGTLGGTGAIANSGQISGYGTINADGGLSNTGTIVLNSGTSIVDSQVTNAENAGFEVRVGKAVFTDDVTNTGLFKTTDASVVFEAGFFNNGTYYSDPSSQTFADLTVGKSGVIMGLTSKDLFQVSNDFLNYSIQSGTWNTAGAYLAFYHRRGQQSSHDPDRHRFRC